MQAAPAHEPEEEGPDLSLAHPWIIAWARLHGFSDALVVHTLNRAARQLAPSTAVYWVSDGVWLTLEEVSNPETRLWLVDWADSRGLPLPHAVIRAWITPDYAPSSTGVG